MGKQSNQTNASRIAPQFLQQHHHSTLHPPRLRRFVCHPQERHVQLFIPEHYSVEPESLSHLPLGAIAVDGAVKPLFCNAEKHLPLLPFAHSARHYPHRIACRSYFVLGKQPLYRPLRTQAKCSWKPKSFQFSIP